MDYEFARMLSKALGVVVHRKKKRSSISGTERQDAIPARREDSLCPPWSSSPRCEIRKISSASSNLSDQCSPGGIRAEASALGYVGGKTVRTASGFSGEIPSNRERVVVSVLAENCDPQQSISGNIFLGKSPETSRPRRNSQDVKRTPKQLHMGYRK